MKNFPMFIKLANRTVVIIGGEEQAAQKVRLISKTDAKIVLVSPTLNDELTAIVGSGGASHYPGSVTDKILKNVALVFIATGSAMRDADIAACVQKSGVLVNVVDQPELCDVFTPSIVDRTPVVVAIGTEGTAPVLAREIKTRIEQILHPELGRFAAKAGRLRNRVAKEIPQGRRRAFWQWVFTGLPFNQHKSGAFEQAERTLENAVSNITLAQAPCTGTVSVISFQADRLDLLTLRAVERLQTADVIYYHEISALSVLELARRDALRIKTDPLQAVVKVAISSSHRFEQATNEVFLISGQKSYKHLISSLKNRAKNKGSVFEIIPTVPDAMISAGDDSFVRTANHQIIASQAEVPSGTIPLKST